MQGLLRELHCNGAGAAQHDKFLGLAQDLRKKYYLCGTIEGGLLEGICRGV